MLTDTTIEGLLRRSGCTRWPRASPSSAGIPTTTSSPSRSVSGLLVDRELIARDNRRLERHLKTAKLQARRPRSKSSTSAGHADSTATGPLARRVALGRATTSRASSSGRPASARPSRLRARPRRDPPRPLRALSPCTAPVRRARHRTRRRPPRPAHGELGARRRAPHRRLPHPPAERRPGRGPARGRRGPQRHARRSSPASCRSPTGTRRSATPTIADAVLDRLLEHAHRIELHGESLRRPAAAAEDTASDAAKPRRQPPQKRS